MLSPTLNLVRRARAGGQVQRCHTVKHVGEYSVAEHTFGVCCLLQILWPSESRRLMPYALFHDIAEAETGDVPRHATEHDTALADLIMARAGEFHRAHGFPWEGDLFPVDWEMLRAADILELFLWTREQPMPNQGIKKIRMRAKAIIRQKIIKGAFPEAAAELFEELEGLME